MHCSLYTLLHILAQKSRICTVPYIYYHIFCFSAPALDRFLIYGGFIKHFRALSFFRCPSTHRDREFMYTTTYSGAEKQNMHCSLYILPHILLFCAYSGAEKQNMHCSLYILPHILLLRLPALDRFFMYGRFTKHFRALFLQLLSMSIDTGKMSSEWMVARG
jgi:hypothetical protein